MNLRSGIGDSKRSETIIKSLLWNTIIEVFQNEKAVDITPYLVSVSKRSEVYFIKTNNPLINSELILLEGEIKKLFLKKLKKVGIELNDIVLKYC